MFVLTFLLVSWPLVCWYPAIEVVLIVVVDFVMVVKAVILILAVMEVGVVVLILAFMAVETVIFRLAVKAAVLKLADIAFMGRRVIPRAIRLVVVRLI